MAANPALDLPVPDIEAFLWSQVKDVGGVTLRAEVEEEPYPFVHVIYSIYVTTPGGSKQEASDKAQDVAARLRAALHVDWPEGRLLGVETVEAPAWSPRANGAPAYDAQYRAWSRARSH